MAAAAAAKVVHRCDAAKETGQLGKSYSVSRASRVVSNDHDLMGFPETQKENDWPVKK